MRDATTYLAVWLVLNMTLVTMWDVGVLLFAPTQPTISLQLYRWGQAYPLLYFWMGLAIGHIMLPLVLRQ